MKLYVKRLQEDAILPNKAHVGDSGFDLFAAEDVVIAPGETKVVKTGIAIKLPVGYEAQVRSRSGISSKTKLRVANAPGTVDEPYRGEVGVIFDNISNVATRSEYIHTKYGIDGKLIPNDHASSACTYRIRKGDKIAQLIIAPVAHPTLVEVEELDETERGSNGFGSTGVTSS